MSVKNTYDTVVRAVVDGLIATVGVLTIVLGMALVLWTAWLVVAQFR